MNTPDWDRELAKIDKHIAALPDDQPVPAPAPAAPGAPAENAAGPPRTVAARHETTAVGVYGRLLLAVALGVSMLFWPYPTQCGIGLFGYLAAALTVVAAGVWTAAWTWRHRTAPAHTLALLLVLWGLVLGGMEVLPRIGYAVPDPAHPAGWMCK
jgi:hypothetical protein